MAYLAAPSTPLHPRFVRFILRRYPALLFYVLCACNRNALRRCIRADLGV